MDSKTNKLISVQLAVTTKILLKLPRYTDYKLSKLNPIDSISYEISKSGRLNKILLEETINNHLNLIRNNNRSKDIEVSINKLVDHNGF